MPTGHTQVAGASRGTARAALIGTRGTHAALHLGTATRPRSAENGAAFMRTNKPLSSIAAALLLSAGTACGNEVATAKPIPDAGTSAVVVVLQTQAQRAADLVEARVDAMSGGVSEVIEAASDGIDTTVDAARARSAETELAARAAEAETTAAAARAVEDVTSRAAEGDVRATGHP